MSNSRSRLYYVDNLRIVLSCLVVLFHFSTTYGAVGSWAYVEAEPPFPGSYFLTLFTATCQSFFMGTFFLLSAYFTHGAFERKGVGRFALDRVVRLGIPLVIYMFLLEPLTGYFARCWMPDHLSFQEILSKGYGRSVGAMWFLVALLCFNALYTVARTLLTRIQGYAQAGSFALQDRWIVGFVLALSAVTFLWRIMFPIGWILPYFSFNLAHFPQYIVLFTLGVAAARHRIGNPIPLVQAKRWGLFAALMVAFGFPVVFLAGGAASGNVEPFFGGVHWQSLAFSFWEQCTGIAIIVALLGITYEKWNNAGRVEKELAASAYALYVFHPPIIVAVSVFFREWTINPLLKFLVLSPVALAVCFAFAGLIRRLPGAKRVF